MTLALAGLAGVLRAAGVQVEEFSGWLSRGQTDGPFTPRGVMWHHDASAPGDSPGVPAMMANLDNNGAQCWVDRRGVWHLVAAGRMWHAGSGGGWGRIPANAGNTYSVGIETDHTTGEDWPAAQVSSLRRGTAVLLRWLNASPHDSLCGHKEYRTTNPDPHGLDMAQERNAVAALMANPDGEDDMSWDTPIPNHYGSNPPAKVLVAYIDEHVNDANAKLDALIALVGQLAKDPTLTPERAGEIVRDAVAEQNAAAIAQINTAINQHLEVVREVLTERDADIADEVVDEIGRRTLRAA